MIINNNNKKKKDNNIKDESNDNDVKYVGDKTPEIRSNRAENKSIKNNVPKTQVLIFTIIISAIINMLILQSTMVYIRIFGFTQII